MTDAPRIRERVRGQGEGWGPDTEDRWVGLWWVVKEGKESGKMAL